MASWQDLKDDLDLWHGLGEQAQEGKVAIEVAGRVLALWQPCDCNNGQVTHLVDGLPRIPDPRCGGTGIVPADEWDKATLGRGPLMSPQELAGYLFGEGDR